MRTPLALIAAATLAACGAEPLDLAERDPRAQMWVASAPVIAIEICDDGVDNDGDGDADTADRDCRSQYRSRWGTLGFEADFSMEGHDWWPGDLLVLRTSYGDLNLRYNPRSGVAKYGQTEISDARGNLLGVIAHPDGEAIGIELVVAAGHHADSLLIATESGVFWVPDLTADGSTESPERLRW